EGARVSWDYDLNDFVFNVYRNNAYSFEGAELVASVRERYFVDEGVVPMVDFFYFVTAVDNAGEESRPKWSVIGSERFFLIRIEPTKTTSSFGETIKLVFQVNSTKLSELENLRAVLINKDSGVVQQFEFDNTTKRLSITIKLPEEQQVETGTKNISYGILASAELDGEPLYDHQGFDISLGTQVITPWNMASLMPGLLLLAFCSVGLISWKWLIRKRAKMDGLEMQLREVFKERAIWQDDFMHRRVSEEMYKEKTRELRAHQLELERERGIGGKGIVVRANPLEGCTAGEIEEIMSIVRAIGVPRVGSVVVSKRKMNKDQLRAYLVGLDKGEKVARKVAELVFQKHGSEKQGKAGARESEKQESAEKRESGKQGSAEKRESNKQEETEKRKTDEKRESDEKENAEEQKSEKQEKQSGDKEKQDKPEKTKRETTESEDDPEIKEEWQKTAEKEESEANKSGKSRKKEERKGNKAWSWEKN
ncbi:MAG: hypothetical protein Q8N60_02460, partial [Candidatus Diapherotrites archaeon]|nr:hypothetical protein [Candidatus Diapherotrites archaeon]